MANKPEEQLGWGMPKNFYAKVKFYSVNITKGVFLVAVLLFTLQLNGSLFPVDQPLQYLAFILITNLLAIYLILPTSAGGTNFNAIFCFLIRRKHKYFSIDRNVYPTYLGHTAKKKRRGF